MTRSKALLVAMAAVLTVAVGGCGFGSNGRDSDGRIIAVGAENQYADVIRQIGGRYVDVSSILSNPSTDPHTFEASPSIARKIARAGVIVQNGLGYDQFMNQLEQATSSRSRHVITVQTLLGKPDSTANPHLWYDPATMPKVAVAIAAQLGRIDPKHKSTFQRNAAAFIASLQAWRTALAHIASAYPRAEVATTEPVADYLIQAAGLHNATPWSFQEAVMKGSDP
ncbi:MAG: metal ABC transporter solute-binding protein, Zn/Mn family [Marmoricola sp.]